MIIRLLTVVLMLLFFASSIAAEEIISKKDYTMEDFPFVTVDSSGNVYVLYYSKDYHLNVIRNGMETASVRQENAKGSFAHLGFLKDAALLTWRPKFGNGEKFVYVHKSEDSGKTFSQPLILNTAKDALLPISVAGDGDKKHYVIWVDERAGKDYRLYMNRSIDGGRTYLAEDNWVNPDMLGAILHNLLLDGDRISLVFYRGDGIYIKNSADDGITWSDAVKIAPISQWSPSVLRSVKAGKRTFVFWSGVLGLYGAYSDDLKSWKTIQFDESFRMDISRLAVAAHGDKVFVTSAWRPLGSKEKFHVWFYKTDDSGITWSKPVRINRNKYYTTSATFPDMHADEKGNIIVVWQDHRLIRGNIYLNYSTDFGDTWLEQDIDIEESPGKHNSHYPFVVKAKNAYNIVWIRYADDRIINEGFIVQKEFRIKK